MSNRSSHVNSNLPLLKGFDSIKAGKSDAILRPELTTQPKFKSSEAYFMLKEKKIKIYSPISLPVPEMVPTRILLKDIGDTWCTPESQSGGLVVQMKEGKIFHGGQGYLKLSPDKLNVYLENELRFLPSYIPSYFHAGIDQQLFSQVFHFFSLALGFSPSAQVDVDSSMDQEKEAEWIYGNDGLYDTGKTYAFTSGCLSQQIKRLGQNRDVAQGLDGHHKNKSLKDLKLTLDDVGKLLEETLPLPRIPDDEIMYLFGNLSNYFGTVDATAKEVSKMAKYGGLAKTYYNFLPQYEKQTKAGLPFRQVHKKSEVYWDMVVAANMYLEELSEAIAGQDQVTRVKELNKKYWYLSVGYLFPKAERYKIVEREYKVRKAVKKEDGEVKWEKKTEVRTEAEKTRNIWSAPFISHMLASVPVAPLDTGKPINVDNSDTPSLYKWTPFKGGMNRLINKIYQAKEHKFFIYADNLYILYVHQDGSKDWYSIDLTKGESNATRSHMKAWTNYLLNSLYTVREDGHLSINYNSTWGFLLRNVIPSWFVDTTGLLGNMLVRVYGQGSGNTYTFYTNHVLTSILADHWRKKKFPHPTTKEFEDMQQELGIDFKIELGKQDITRELDKARDHNMSNKEKFPFYNDPEVSFQPDVVVMDLLGWDACYFPPTKTFVPVLNKDRLFKASVLPKNFETTNGMVRAIYDNIRRNSLILCGAWVYPSLHRALRSLVSSNYAKLSATVSSIVKNSVPPVEVPYDLAQMKDPEILKYLGGISLPPELTTFEFLYTGDPIEKPQSCKYEPINRKTEKMMLLTPGMSVHMEYTQSILRMKEPKLLEFSDEKAQKMTSWADEAEDEEEDHIVHKWGREDPTFNSRVSTGLKKVSVKVRNLVLDLAYVGDINRYYNPENLYQAIDFNDTWAQASSKLKGTEIVNPASVGNFFDEAGNLTGTSRTKPIPKYPDMDIEDLKAKVAETGRNWQTAKRNEKRRKVYSIEDTGKTVTLPVENLYKRREKRKTIEEDESDVVNAFLEQRKERPEVPRSVAIGKYKSYVHMYGKEAKSQEYFELKAKELSTKGMSKDEKDEDSGQKKT